MMMNEAREIVDIINCPRDYQKRRVYTRIITVENGDLASCNGCDNMSGAKECQKCMEHYTIKYSTCLNKDDR